MNLAAVIEIDKHILTFGKARFFVRGLGSEEVVKYFRCLTVSIKLAEASDRLKELSSCCER